MQFLGALKARGAYDTLVYIDGTSIMAVNSHGNYVATGTTGTDDATVINAALAAAGTNGTCHINPGTYTPAATIAVAGHTLVGAPNRTTIFDGPSAVSCLTVTQNGHVENIAITGAYTKGISISDGDVHIKDVYIYDATAMSHGVNVYINKGATDRGDILLEDITISDISGYGIYTTMLGGSTLSNYRLIRCKALNCGRASHTSAWVVGIDPLEAGSIDTIILEDCEASGCYESGFYTEPHSSGGGSCRIMKFINCHAQDNGQKSGFSYGNGFCIRHDGDLITFNNCTSTGNLGGGFWLDSADIKNINANITTHGNLQWGAYIGYASLLGGTFTQNSDSDYIGLYLRTGTRYNTTFNINASNPTSYGITCINTTGAQSVNCTYNIKLSEPVKNTSTNYIGILSAAQHSTINVEYVTSTDTGEGFAFYNCSNCNINVKATLGGTGDAYGYCAKYDGLNDAYATINHFDVTFSGGKGFHLTRLSNTKAHIKQITGYNAKNLLNINSNDTTNGFAILNKKNLEGYLITNGNTSEITANAIKYTGNTGTATITNGTTNIDVTHNMLNTPAADQINVTPTNNLGTATKYWISDITATTFRINVDQDPGPSTATFSWSVV
jgi:hypothetical protein